MSDGNKNRKNRVSLTGSVFAAFTALAVLLASIILFSGRDPSRTWPLLLTAIGLAELLYAGLSRHRRFARGHIVPSFIFIGLSVVFSLFSFKIIPTRFGDFVLMYWPYIVLVTALFILAVWRYSLYRRQKRAEKRKGNAASGSEGSATSGRTEDGAEDGSAQ